MKTMILAAAMAAVTLPVTAPAVAQSDKAQREYEKDIRKADKELRKDLRKAGSREEVRDARRDYRRNVRSADRDYRTYRNYDHDRPEPGQKGYNADDYYRSGSNYEDRRLADNDRVYRGQNNQYYCRRPDGTTGLIIGGIGGGILGNVIAPGGSSTLGTILGAVAGGVGGRAIDRKNVRCD